MIKKLKGFDQIEPTELQLSPFKEIAKDWMEVVVGEPNSEIGAMTASWGGIGYIWNKPVVFVLVRGEEYRFTRHILDARPVFSLNFLGAENQKAKAFLGSKHGWDYEDKIEAAGLTMGWCGLDVEHDPKFGIGTHVHAPFIEEAETVLVCETITAQELPEESFLSPSVWEKWYTAEGQHRLYIAEIKGAFLRQHAE